MWFVLLFYMALPLLSKPEIDSVDFLIVRFSCVLSLKIISKKNCKSRNCHDSSLHVEQNILPVLY